MSYIINNSGYTEHEISIGLPFSMAKGYWAHDDNHEEIEDCGWAPNIETESLEILTSNTESAIELRAIISRFLIETERPHISLRYAKRERLPEEFRIAALRNDAAPILVKSYLRKILKIYPDDEVNSEIIKLTQGIYENLGNKTTFDRVGEIQSFIHSVADKTNGGGACLDLPSQSTRNLLSACRLHIGLKDSIDPGTKYWGRIWDAENSASEKEYKNPEAGFIPDRKKRIKWWRVPQMKPVSSYASSATRSILQRLAQLPYETDIQRYRSESLKIASGSSGILSPALGSLTYGEIPF